MSDMELGALDLAIAGGAGFLAGGVNAIAGGGTLISFPTLVALGVPAVNANITNTVALCPGYFGGAMGQREELVPQRGRLPALSIVAGLGGLLGSILLTQTSNATFKAVVPFLIVAACVLLALQEPLRRWLRRHHADPPRAAGAASAVEVATRPSVPALVGVFLAAIYGGFFGAGLGIMLLAILGVFLDDSLIRLNALKSALALVINLLAALFFLFSGKVVWAAALVMAVTSLLGGGVGGRLAVRLRPDVLRVAVVVFGLAVAVTFWV
jgi:uncharacterized membrane protein YfcA